MQAGKYQTGYGVYPSGLRGMTANHVTTVQICQLPPIKNKKDYSSFFSMYISTRGELLSYSALLPSKLATIL